MVEYTPRKLPIHWIFDKLTPLINSQAKPKRETAKRHCIPYDNLKTKRHLKDSSIPLGQCKIKPERLNLLIFM